MINHYYDEIDTNGKLIKKMGDALYTLLLAEHDGDADWVCGNSAYASFIEWQKPGG